MKCMKPEQDPRLPWEKVQTDKHGSVTELLLPSVAIASLVFHPCIWPTLHKRAEEVVNDDGQRVYSHPFTCDQAIAAQGKVDNKEEINGYQNMLVGCNAAKDKSEVERTKSMDLQYLKVLNTHKREWFKRHSKIQLSVHPEYTADSDQTPEWNSMEKHQQYQRSLAVVLIGLEACAKYGIKCKSEYPPITIFHSTPPFDTIDSICNAHSQSKYGKWCLWPIIWVWSTDREEQAKVTGVNKAPRGKYVTLSIR